MERKLSLLLPVGLLISVMMFAGIAMPAAAQTFTLAPGESHTARYTATDGDSIAYHWTASQSVAFTMSGPGGNLLVDLSSTQGNGIREVTQTGEYLLVWTNLHTSSVTLTYEISILPFHVGGLPMAAFVAILLVAIIIIAVIILIVFVVFRQDRRRTENLYRQQQPYYAGPPVFPPTAEGKCSRCGAPVRSDSAFCEKCGARLK